MPFVPTTTSIASIFGAVALWNVIGVVPQAAVTQTAGPPWLAAGNSVRSESRRAAGTERNVSLTATEPEGVSTRPPPLRTISASGPTGFSHGPAVNMMLRKPDGWNKASVDS